MIQSIRGTKDILPIEIYKWQYVENIIREVTKNYSYKEIRTPIFEKTEVFSRSIGENTDIVNKEMYSFKDRSEESITLRPEQTASLIRSVLQHNLTNEIATLRLWYYGPYFRYERPQKGRQRQFHQFGVECISSPNPEADIEVLLLANNLIAKLGITEYELQINSLGNENSRKIYRDELVKYLERFKSELSHDSQIRLEANPLRVLDSKDENDRKIIENAPKITDYLDEESQNHFNKVKELLDSQNIKYNLEPNLVRGLDYYCHTVFEFRSTALGAQDAFGGGGRYDGLINQLGGKPTPAVGFAMGVERIILILESLGVFDTEPQYNDIFIVCSGEEFYPYSLSIAEKLRGLKYNVLIDLNKKSFKSQMREAGKSGAKYCIIIGENEFKNKTVTIKNLEIGEQNEINFNELHTLKLI